ncbi:MAG: DUF882 domain-containing protein [Myxococcales bacterium]|nr:DUF882 domain-containing protein [Myxococcales bacterium]
MRSTSMQAILMALGLVTVTPREGAAQPSPAAPRVRLLANAATPSAPTPPVLSSSSTTRPRSQMVPLAPRERLVGAVGQGASDDVTLPVRTPRNVAHRGLQSRGQRLCLRPSIEVRRLRSGVSPRWFGPLTDCSGRPTLRAMAAFALMAQPGRPPRRELEPAVVTLRRLAPAAGLSLADELSVPRWRQRVRAMTTTVQRDRHTHDPVVEVAPGARTLHPRLLQLLQAVIDHFPGHPVELVSGYRPGEGESRHAHARAIDFRLRGIAFEELRDFCRTLPNAGVGYYPNSVFVHMDVRDPDEGSAFWTDYSGPGETPRYGHWPPTDQDVQTEVDYLINRNEDELERTRQEEWSPDVIVNGSRNQPTVQRRPPTAPSSDQGPE